MRLPLALAAVLAACGPLPAQPQHIAPTDALSPEAAQKAFTLPPGFEAQLVASEPVIGKPIQCAFDAKGRLWVTTSRHYPHAATGPASDKLYVLSDIDPVTGKAGRVTAFAGDLNIPIGVLPLPDCASCLVSEVGRIVKLTDTDGDGKADTRETILAGFGTADTHGMMNSFLLMPDGWVYACHGFSNLSRVRAKDGSEVVMQSGNTFRFKPDGGRVEPWTFGQVNPFGLTADPWFNLYTADCHSKPVTQLIRGATYQSFSKPHDGLGFAPHVARHDHGSTALCGLAWLDSPAFPAAYTGRVVLGNVVTNRVNADTIRWHGGTPEAVEAPDLLVSSDPWFRPADCKLGPDGAVYVTDFYNKVIGHYEVDLNHPARDKDRGRVWRVVYRGADAKPSAAPGDLTALPLDKLDAALGHPSLAVRLPATLEMQRRGAKPPYNAAGNEFYQAHRVWVDAPPAAADEPELVRVHRALAGHARAGTATGRLARAQADAWAADPAAGNLPAVLAVLKAAPDADTHLTYAARLALRATLAAPGGFAAAAQLPNDRARLADAALGVPTPAAAAYLAAGTGLTPDQFRHVGRHGDEAAAARAAADLAARRAAGEPTAVLGMEALVQGRQAKGEPLPAAAVALATRLCDEGLTRTEPRLAAVSANLAGTLKLTALAAPLTALLTRSDRPAADRGAAAHALAVCDPAAAAGVLGKLLADPAADPAVREQAAAALGRVTTPAARSALVAAFAVAPARVASGVALGLAGTADGARELVAAVAAGKAAPHLLAARPVRDRVNQSAGGTLAGEVERLTRNLPTEDGRVAALLPARRAHYAAGTPDAAAGQALFAKQCAACHQLGGAGGKVGPQLDGVGNRGLDRLLEDVLTPSRNVDAAFRATTLHLADGRTLTGLVVREDGRVTVLADAAGQEVRVPAADIESRAVTGLSPMPANFDTALTEAEFRDLLGYLLAQRASK